MNGDDMNPTDEELARAMEAARKYLEPFPGVRRERAELVRHAAQFTTLTPTQQAVHLEHMWHRLAPIRGGTPHWKLLEFVPDSALTMRALALLDEEEGRPRN